MITREHLDLLAQPFPEETLGIKVQSLSKARDKAMLVAYLQHTDVMNRIEAVDPSWEFKQDRMEIFGELFVIHATITIHEVSRSNCGEGDSPKGAYSDALKRCAMLFGVGRYLYDSDQVWVPYNESTDKYKSWTYADYKKHLRQGQAGVEVSKKEAAPKAKPQESVITGLKDAIKLMQSVDPKMTLDECLQMVSGNERAKFDSIDKITSPDQIAKALEYRKSALAWVDAAKAGAK